MDALTSIKEGGKKGSVFVFQRLLILAATVGLEWVGSARLVMANISDH
jgi:hypothetical protein